LQKNHHNIGFWGKRQFFSAESWQKSPENEIIKSTPAFAQFRPLGLFCSELRLLNQA
jgi:hypothetical protein